MPAYKLPKLFGRQTFGDDPATTVGRAPVSGLGIRYSSLTMRPGPQYADFLRKNNPDKALKVLVAAFEEAALEEEAFALGLSATAFRWLDGGKQDESMVPGSRCRPDGLRCTRPTRTSMHVPTARPYWPNSAVSVAMSSGARVVRNMTMSLYIARRASWTGIAVDVTPTSITKVRLLVRTLRTSWSSRWSSKRY